MENKKQNIDGFYVLGLEIRTTNAIEMSPQGKIPGLWQKFNEEQIFAKISSKLDQAVYAVYHNYESDANGPYSLTVGVKVAETINIPEGLMLMHIPSQNYIQYTSAKGAMPMIAIDCWQTIWQQSNSGLIKRQFTYDFELYDHRCADLSAAQIDVFIATL